MSIPLAECALLLSADDDVAVATRELAAGTAVLIGPAEVTLPGGVPRGHKLAVRAVSRGSPVRKYGQPIGVATADIAVGDHVHVHNLAMHDAARSYEFGTARVTPVAPPGQARTFQGYRRADGRVGTRNHVAVLTSVNCSAPTARMIAEQFRGPALDAFPGVD